MRPHFISYLGFSSTEKDQIYNGATPTYSLSYAVNTMPADTLAATKGAKASAAWYWPPKSECFVSSMRTVNIGLDNDLLSSGNKTFPELGAGSI